MPLPVLWTPNPNVFRSVFACNAAGDLILYTGTDQPNWQAQNVTLAFPAGFRIAGTPRPLAGVQFDTNRGQHFWRADVFGRSTSGALIHYWWTPWDQWQTEDLTAKHGGPSFASDPVPVLGYQNRFQWESLRHDVFGCNATNQLIHYWWAVYTGWSAENLTTMTGGPAVMADTVEVVVSRQNGYLRKDVFGRSPDDQLIHYWWSAEPPSGWHAENLTQFTSGPIFEGAPRAVLSHQTCYLRHDVFARNSSEQLIHYWWYGAPPAGWHAENLTTAAGGPTILGKPEVVVSDQNSYLRHDVFARNSYAQLIHYWWYGEPPAGWHAENLTGEARPNIGIDLDAVATTWNSYLRHDVFGLNRSAQLIHYWWYGEPPAGWHAENLTQFTSGPTLASALAVYVTVTAYSMKHEVFGRSDTQPAGPGHLIRYWWTAANGWNAEDETSFASGPAIARDPVVMTLPLESAPVYIRNWSQYDVNEVWQVSGGGPGAPANRRLLTKDLSPLAAPGSSYNDEILVEIPLIHDPADPTPTPTYVLEYIQERLSFGGSPQYHTNPLSTIGFAPGVIRVAGYSLVRETIFIFDWSSFPTSRFEQMLLGPDGRLYLYLPGDGFPEHPEVHGPILLQTLIDEGYGLYRNSQLGP